MSFQFNSTEPGQAPPKQRRRLRKPSLGVVAYVIAIISPLALLPAAYVRANVVYLGASFRGLMHCLFVAPLLGLALGVVALLRRPSASSRKFALAAVVIGLFGMGVVSMHANSISVAGTVQHKGTCLNNLKEIAEALQLYTSEYDGTLPSSYLYGHSKTWSPSDFTAFASRRGDLQSGSKKSHMTWPTLLYAYKLQRRTMWCPSDPDALDDSPDAVVSYYWKAAIDRAWYGGFRMLDSFAAPSDQMLAYERLGWHWGAPERGLTEGIQINTVFLDGHVETAMISQSGYTRQENPPGPLPKSGVGEPAWFNCESNQANLPYQARTSDRGQHWDPKQWIDSL